jgi:lysyl-tRNA synthetase class 2
MLERIRAFFCARGILEVDTPLLGRSSATEPQLAFFSTDYSHPPFRSFFLQTSPEFAMKRLLASGSGSIYQICKAFRNGEHGRFHNPEFTLLEWYHVGFELPQLMDEIDALFEVLFEGALPPAQRIGYPTLFEQYTQLDPLTFQYDAYRQFAESVGLGEAATLCAQDHGLWLDLLFSHCVQPHLGIKRLTLVYDYPACQSSLARRKVDQPQLTERVEAFMNGLELGNGFYELADPLEQQHRFEAELHLRVQQGLPNAVMDTRLLAALTAGLPDCAGMALGLDRILMQLMYMPSISEVLSFDITRA